MDRPGRIHWYFDQTRCTGCGACAVACKDWNELPAGAQTQWRRVYTAELGVFPRVDVVHLCLSCLHCAEPACAKACPTGAIRKDAATGFVQVDRKACRGCRDCERACPYGAPQYAPGETAMMKCDFCASRQAQGLQPACVEACPYLALDSGSEAELRDRHGPLVPLAADALPGIDAEHASTRPAAFVRTRPLRNAPGSPVALRKNGAAVLHLRAAAETDPDAWRVRARTPYRDKGIKNSCE